MARMIDIIRKLRAGGESAEPTADPTSPEDKDEQGNSLLDVIDSAITAQPPAAVQPAPDTAGIEGELRDIFGADGPLSDPSDTTTPPEADAPTAAAAPAEPGDAAEPTPTQSEPPTAATAKAEPQSPSEILTEAEVDALLAPVPVEEAEAAETEDPMDLLADPPVQPMPVEPIDDLAEPADSQADGVETVEPADVVVPALEDVESFPAELDAQAEAEDVKERAAEIESEIEMLAQSTPAVSEEAVEAEPMEEGSVDEVPDDITFADDLSAGFLAKYGLTPDEINLPTRQEWEEGKNRPGMTLGEIEARRDELLAELGIDLEELRAEQQRELQEPEPVENGTSGPETSGAEAVAGAATETESGLAALENELGVLDGALPEESEESEMKAGALSAMGGELHALDAAATAESPDPAAELAEPLTASHDLKSELEREFESEVAAEAALATEAAEATPMTEAAEGAPQETLVEEPEPSGEEPHPPPAVAATTASREELFEEVETQPEEQAPDDYTRNPVELIKVLIGLLSIVLVLWLLILFALG